MRTTKSDVQRDVFAIVKISILIFCNASNLCIINAFLQWKYKFYTVRKKYVFAVQKIAMFGPFSTASWSIFYWKCEAMHCKTERMFWVSRYQGSVDQDRHQLLPPSRRGIDLRSQSLARVLDDGAT